MPFTHDLPACTCLRVQNIKFMLHTLIRVLLAIKRCMYDDSAEKASLLFLSNQCCCMSDSCIMFAASAEAAVPSYPPPPGALPATSTTQDTTPPPAYDQVMQQSTKHSRASHAAVTTDATGHGSQGNSPSGSPSGKSQLGTGARSGATDGTDIAGGAQVQGIHLGAIGRSAEEALQIQVQTVALC